MFRATLSNMGYSQMVNSLPVDTACCVAVKPCTLMSPVPKAKSLGQRLGGRKSHQCARTENLALVSRDQKWVHVPSGIQLPIRSGEGADLFTFWASWLVASKRS